MATFLQICLVLAALLPLGSFTWIALAGVARGRREDSARAARSESGAPNQPLAGAVATGAIGLSFVLVLLALLLWASAGVEARAAWSWVAADDSIEWLRVGGVSIEAGVKLDSLTIIVCLMVTLCATCIHVFSLGYMQRDRGYARFFAFLSLFCFAMLGLVISSNLLLVFIFWELVGVCSYFLIGHWYEKSSANRAALKAFVVNRVGDFGFTIGLGLCIAYLGTLSLDRAPAVFEAGAQRAGQMTDVRSAAAASVPRDSAERSAKLFQPALFGVSLATWLGLALFCGAVGKSAQVPLHVWLPDAMEGPTPVSALIHAATMVAAGVYLVARIFPLLTAEAQLVIAVVGCLTLTLGAILATVQTDIKRVLAYSTVSQLGYMLFGLGVGAWIGALFHLLTHAFFKALLFLGAGQVIAGANHEQDMRRLGGLKSKMPTTALTFLIGVLAISAAGIPWLHAGIGAYFSKDEILAVALHRVTTGGLSIWLLVLPVLVAYLTPFYMGRCYILTFLGEPRNPAQHAHAHESPVLYVPLLVLAVMTLVSGWFLFRRFVESAAPESAPLAIAINGNDVALVAANRWLPLLVGFAWVAGLGAAWRIYRAGPEGAARVKQWRLVAPVYRLAENRFYFDSLYNTVFVKGTLALATLCRFLDNWFIDGIVNTAAYAVERIGRFTGMVLDDMGVDGLAKVIAGAGQRLGAALRGVQTGLVRQYVLLLAAGMVGVVIYIASGGGLDWAIFVVLAAGAAIAVPWRRVMQAS